MTQVVQKVVTYQVVVNICVVLVGDHSQDFRTIFPVQIQTDLSQEEAATVANEFKDSMNQEKQVLPTLINLYSTKDIS
tara:strand:- start:536 stop:769 length:234 start_codon:yes stop_codon:yes gene_type:complete